MRADECARPIRNHSVSREPWYHALKALPNAGYHAAVTTFRQPMPRFPFRNCLPASVALAAALSLTGCFGLSLSKKGEMLAKETFDADGTFSRTFEHAPAQVCEAARRALLSQGYVVAKATPDAIEAGKNFQPESEVHEQLQLRVSCVVLASGQSWISASANQERYNLSKRNTSASVGVGGLGSLSVPIGSTDDSLVRVGSMTVQDPEFYRSFFKLVERYLPAVITLDTEAEAKAKAEKEAEEAAAAKARQEAAAAAAETQPWQSFAPVVWPSAPMPAANTETKTP